VLLTETDRGGPQDARCAVVVARTHCHGAAPEPFPGSDLGGLARESTPAMPCVEKIYQAVTRGAFGVQARASVPEPVGRNASLDRLTAPKPKRMLVFHSIPQYSTVFHSIPQHSAFATNGGFECNSDDR
jgi:hypothetical protein